MGGGNPPARGSNEESAELAAMTPRSPGGPGVGKSTTDGVNHDGEGNGAQRDPRSNNSQFLGANLDVSPQVPSALAEKQHVDNFWIHQDNKGTTTMIRSAGIKGLLGVGLVIGGMSAFGFAMTASNTVPAGKAGDGAGLITGYTVTGVDYTLDSANPQEFDSVSFTLNSAPAATSTVKVRLVSGGTTWYPCAMSGTPAVIATCDISGATVAAANELTVVAAD